MKTYKQVFSELAKAKRAALIPFFVIGDPDFDTSLAIVKTAIDAGADILELGIPFSDPIADGPTIQKADIRARNSGMSVTKAREFVRKVKDYKDIPIGLLMYYNLIYQYGTKKFFSDFHKAGVNSVLVADLSVDDADEIMSPATEAGLDTVFMVTPNTDAERMKLIASKTTGFIYTVSLLGVTGSRDKVSGDVRGLVERLKEVTDVPICVGFGISKPEHAVEVAKAGADGVIIGSKIVQLIEENLGKKEKCLAEISTFVSEVRKAIERQG
ncbi:MAG: tryptophan synthase subunit alpha [Phycisphaerae bacterium]|nr:tryptophan synthase subunit alpha [Phycisphaerae bacterium]MDD5380335.1 tryptophan synthase subunit alpha [Phycisphaerae bacterium]